MSRSLLRKPGCLLLAVSMALCAAPAQAQVPDGLADLVGSRGRDGESELERRGYVLNHTSKSDSGSYTYWWHAGRAACVRVLTTDGRYERIDKVSNADCGQKDASGLSTGAAVAIGAAALLGIAALAHKSHHRGDRSYDERQTADFERGFRDGLYNHPYHNWNNAREYSDGYSQGVEQRRHESGYRSGNTWRGGYAAHAYVGDLQGRNPEDARSRLQERGFRPVDDRGQGGGRAHWIYWNASTRQCLDIQIRGYAVVSVFETGDRACR